MKSGYGLEQRFSTAIWTDIIVCDVQVKVESPAYWYTLFCSRILRGKYYVTGLTNGAVVVA